METLPGTTITSISTAPDTTITKVRLKPVVSVPKAPLPLTTLPGLHHLQDSYLDQHSDLAGVDDCFHDYATSGYDHVLCDG